MKSILKEIIIIILLCVAICLILCVIFYSYLPTNMVVPSTVQAYTTSDTIKNEINEEVVEYPKQNIVFEITDSDLTLYKQSQSYDPGKANPFASSNTNNTNTVNSESTSTSNTSSSSTSSSSTKVTTGTNTNSDSTSSKNTFFEDTKLK